MRRKSQFCKNHGCRDPCRKNCEEKKSNTSKNCAKCDEQLNNREEKKQVIRQCDTSVDKNNLFFDCVKSLCSEENTGFSNLLQLNCENVEICGLYYFSVRYIPGSGTRILIDNQQRPTYNSQMIGVILTNGSCIIVDRKNRYKIEEIEYSQNIRGVLSTNTSVYCFELGPDLFKKFTNLKVSMTGTEHMTDVVSITDTEPIVEFVSISGTGHMTYTGPMTEVSHVSKTDNYSFYFFERTDKLITLRLYKGGDYHGDLNIFLEGICKELFDMSYNISDIDDLLKKLK
jgi:hypothetical protein